MNEIIPSVAQFSIRELIIDFFGALVPGFVFVVTAVVLLSMPLIALSTFFGFLFVPIVPDSQLPVEVASDGGRGLLESLSELYASVWFIASFFVLAISFIVGHLFYRQPPKAPDRSSFARIFPASANNAEENLVIRLLFWPWRTKSKAGAEEQHWVCNTPETCEFPYPLLGRYLAHRGLHHLIELVPWDTPSEDTKDNKASAGTPTNLKSKVNRTKNYINILKVRVGYHYPDKEAKITLNEARIRLMSSSWYMSKSLLTISIIALTIAGPTVILTIVVDVFLRPLPYSPIFLAQTAIFPLFGVASTMTLRTKIEEFFHYQRVSEIVFVLETAYNAFRDSPEVLTDICPKFNPRKVRSVSEKEKKPRTKLKNSRIGRKRRS